MSMVAIMEINEREEPEYKDNNDTNDTDKMDDEIDVIHDDSDEEFPPNIKKPTLRRQNEINTGW
eukprot:CAMPEP_0114693934 /NCGR_PEP_ID=MMETSP0191-20121206/69615_1 /TAXON_ID=126664 /ORGANISM="Sorites sp." /LENGTH=63 /DNA_ID=CAMNT_0001988195 /DNA_START=406 /DNA_END=594 /DNA_ORIENTATION=-